MLNFKMSELIYSKIAIENNINNIPDKNALDCMLNLIVYCLQPIREKLNKPMIITSGYRNYHLNQVVKGAAASQHIKGQAADFKVKGMTASGIIEKIRSFNVEFDQLINEYDKWVHISYVKGKNRKQVFKIK